MKRIGSGYKLYRDKKVSMVKEDFNDMKFLVKSKDKFHEVTIINGYFACSCEDFFYRRIKEFEELEDKPFGIRPCKHILACIFYLMAKLGMSDQSKLDKFVENSK